MDKSRFPLGFFAPAALSYAEICSRLKATLFRDLPLPSKGLSADKLLFTRGKIS
ncbi:MAG: hypothetical protein NTZ11_17420 [Gammaproteobacteria bacterium]|nr:hypothetical protein [Gammaproteobacteria bacterium]